MVISLGEKMKLNSNIKVNRTELSTPVIFSVNLQFKDHEKMKKLILLSTERSVQVKKLVNVQ